MSVRADAEAEMRMAGLVPLDPYPGRTNGSNSEHRHMINHPAADRNSVWLITEGVPDNTFGPALTPVVRPGRPCLHPTDQMSFLKLKILRSS